MIDARADIVEVGVGDAQQSRDRVRALLHSVAEADGVDSPEEGAAQGGIAMGLA